MRIKKHYILAAIVILFVTWKSIRSRTYDSDLSLITWMLIVVAISSAYLSWCFRARLWLICLVAGIAGSAVTWFRSSGAVCATCFFEIRGDAIDNGQTFFIDSTQHFFLVATSLSFASVIFGGVIEVIVSRNRELIKNLVAGNGELSELIKVNIVSFLVLLAAVIGTGGVGFVFGEDLMPRLSRNLCTLICASVGIIFGGAWVSTNRPFVNPKIESNDK